MEQEMKPHTNTHTHSKKVMNKYNKQRAIIIILLQQTDDYQIVYIQYSDTSER